jgi:hypothetical protein
VPTLKKKITKNSEVNNLMMPLKFLEKQKQTKPQASRQTEIMKIMVKINEIKNKKTIQRSIKQKLFL